MIIKRLATATCLGVSLIALGAGAPLAATAAASAPTAAAPAKPPAHRKPTVHKAPTMPAVVEPESVQALARMSAYLKTNTSFEVKLSTQRDDVDDFGQILTFPGNTDYKVKLPNNFNIDFNDRYKDRELIYDGRSVTMYDPKTKYYTRFPAPATVRQTLDQAAEYYDVTVPLDDLFHWDEGQDNQSALTSGHYVGDETVNGQEAQHYAFRQPGVDWQIWIAKGDKPVPLRVVIVASEDPARPQFEANLDWNMAPEFAADTFTFTPPDGAKSIPIRSAAR